MNSAPPSRDDILCRLCAILSSGSMDALFANETYGVGEDSCNWSDSYDMTENIVNKSNKNSIVTQMQLYCRHDKISFLLASIIPVWTAETIKGWNGRSSVDAAIRNFGFSSRSALVKHCMKMLLSKFPKHEILKINHPNWYLVIHKRVAVYIYIRTYISMIT
jgi:hypothetical protein